MKLIDSIRKAPIPFEPTIGLALCNDWAANGALAELLMGIGGCSPYLNNILRQEQEWIAEAICRHNPLKNIIPRDLGKDPGRTLRKVKRQAAGYLAMAELSGACSLTETTHLLTNFADAAVAAAFRSALDPYKASGKISCDFNTFVIAMGKMGANELNYSSDIDLIVMFDDRNMDQHQISKLRQVLVRVTRAAIKLLNEVTEYGYVFRTDLRLRPDPSVNPVCIGMTSALEYYESLGRTWERAAFIKARFCAGDQKAGYEFLQQMVPFVWRRYLDFAAIEEAHSLRLKVREKTKTKNMRSIDGYDIKLGAGGIRDIEFFTQTRQLISGGRDPDLRASQTLTALDKLLAKNWISKTEQSQLKDSYTYLRHTEHAIQMIRDAQTQSLPATLEGISRVAAMRGQSLDLFCKKTFEHLKAVNEIVETFFVPLRTHKSEIFITGQNEIIQHWPSYPAMRSDKATALFEKLRPEILMRLYKAPDPKEALIHFDNFLKGLPAGVQVFSLFAANLKLLDLLTDIVVIAPALARYLGQNSGVLDAVLSGEFFAPWPDKNSLPPKLMELLNSSEDYESGLDIARIWTKEWHFRIGVHLLQKVITPRVAIEQYSILAETVLSCVFDFVQQDFEKKFGYIEKSNVAILAMGSLGARNFTSESDLDLILIFDADENENSNGAKKLTCRSYFSRLTQALITALTAPTRYGRLYKVDMRLRPSGRSGPVATSINSFEAYHFDEAWTWEHLALTKGRLITGANKLCDRIEKIRQYVIRDKANWLLVRQSLKDMRTKLVETKPQKYPWDIKNGPGGLQDIELIGQGIALSQGCIENDIVAHLRSGLSSIFFDSIHLNKLIEIFKFLSTVRLLDILLCGGENQRSMLAFEGRKRIHLMTDLDLNINLETVILNQRIECIKTIDLLLQNG